MNSKELLSVTVMIGGKLLENGAEVYRVEDSITRIAEAYGYGLQNGVSVEVFAIPTTVLVTIDSPVDRPLTKQKRVKNRTTNLDKVDRLNNLSRYICKNKPTYHKILKMFQEIELRKSYSFPVVLASFAVIGFSYALFFGGDLKEAFTAAFVGIIIKLVSKIISKIRPSVFFENLICSMIAAAVSVGVFYAGFTDGYDTVIIGSLMTLVPGITLTNCMRDFIAGDFLAGIYTLTEALLIAIGMAIGAATAISVMTAILGG